MTITLEQALRSKGIQITKVDNWGGVRGFTASGKAFSLEKACGTFNEFTLHIDGQNRVAHCLFRTALKKIKAN